MKKIKLLFPTRWKRFLGLRDFKKAHPNMQIIDKGYLHIRGAGNRYYVIVMF